MLSRGFPERYQLLSLFSSISCSFLRALSSSDVHVRCVAPGADFAAKTPPERALGELRSDFRFCSSTQFHVRSL
jgi:hypothetical protein